ncbi:hypothetical protein CDAR_448451 [Caerostris darwini]|uniref:Uncharacterized protein n=1 Tax=Caerostris darwini TaxID=1538125 RepID=A0AAV4QKX0_9ARAC|nr:hypothetical protein CDAR_448451 [Caerostris darwini]
MKRRRQGGESFAARLDAMPLDSSQSSDNKEIRLFSQREDNAAHPPPKTPFHVRERGPLTTATGHTQKAALQRKEIRKTPDPKFQELNSTQKTGEMDLGKWDKEIKQRTAGNKGNNKR